MLNPSGFSTTGLGTFGSGMLGGGCFGAPRARSSVFGIVSALRLRRRSERGRGGVDAMYGDAEALTRRGLAFVIAIGAVAAPSEGTTGVAPTKPSASEAELGVVAEALRRF